MPNHVIVSTLGWSKAPLEAAIAGIAALEFGQADLAVHEGWAHLNPSELAEGGAERVRREAERISALIRQHEMKAVSACNVGLGTAEPAIQERRLDAVCQLASLLGVLVITIGAARRGTAIEDEAERLRRLVPIAGARGVQLTVETHVNQVTETAEQAVRLCEAVPGLGLTLDASHFYAGQQGGKDFSAVLPHVRHVHLRDAGDDWEHIQMPAGAGRVDFRAIVSGLHAVGYGGKFAIEYIDSIPIAAGDGEPGDVPGNIIRMRDLFVSQERAAGIVRT
ncbi:MAG TPA: sugar phosphate isomerase/epimerase family protein [Chloroflexota bacterium]|jgi:sugar phosphate isomerase/epimerase|nr:sugar phosphate isomerase/epimerase family protein [Chloroflexota bacterium]